jgi:hypothetical protein
MLKLPGIGMSKGQLRKMPVFFFAVYTREACFGAENLSRLSILVNSELLRSRDMHKSA